MTALGVLGGRVLALLGRVLALLGRVGSVVLVLVTWEALARLEIVNPVLFPPATVIVGRAIGLVGDGTIVYHAGQSLLRVAIGFAAAVAVGVPLGLLMGRHRAVDRFFSPLFAFGFPVPKIGLVPIVLIAFGLGHLGKIVLVFVDALFPIVLSALRGGQLVERRLVWSAQAMGDGDSAVLRRVVWPAALPHVFTGVRLGLVVALIVVFVSEMVAPGSGLGHLMIVSARNFKIVDMYTAILSIAVLGYVFDRAMLALRARVLAWHDTELTA